MSVFNAIYVNCYTDNANSADEYVTQITAAGWVLSGNVYVKSAYEGISLSARYDADLGYLEIMVIYAAA